MGRPGHRDLSKVNRMAGPADTLLDRALHRGALAGWRRSAARIGTTGAARLDLICGRALELRREIDGFLRLAERRLEPSTLTPDADPLALGTDWVWRPDLWLDRQDAAGLAPAATATAFGTAARMFHDCPRQEIGLRQRRNPGGTDLPPFAVEIDVYAFEGRFLSLVLDLPLAAAQGWTPRHLLRLDMRVEAESPFGLSARLNVRHGPNVARIARQVPLAKGNRVVEFDLAATELDERRISKLWLDLLFEAPAMNRITLRDVMMSRHPRVEL